VKVLVAPTKSDGDEVEKEGEVKTANLCNEVGKC